MKVLKKFKEKLSTERSVIGPFMKTLDPAFVEIAGHANFDFAILDMEHGPVDFSRLQDLIRATQCADIMPIVRIQDDSEISINRALDVGAMGIQIPQVSTAKQAQEAISAAKFPPKGVEEFVDLLGRQTTHH